MSQPCHVPARRRFLALSAGIALAGLLPGTSYARIIQEMQGQVWINGQRANLDSPVQSGDTVRTGPDSRIVFVIGADAHELGPDSTLHLSEDAGFLRLVSGILASSFGAGDKRIQAPSSTIGIRGTAVFFKVEQDHTYFCTCHGDTTISLPDGRSQAVSATHHAAYAISHAETPELRPAEMLYHGDAGVRLLERLAGREPPPAFRE